CGLFGSNSLAETPWTIRTADGWQVQSSRDVPSDIPASRRIEILNEEGDPLVVTDNSGNISGALGGCSFGGSLRGNLFASLAGLALLTLALRRRRLPRA